VESAASWKFSSRPHRSGVTHCFTALSGHAQTSVHVQCCRCALAQSPADAAAPAPFDGVQITGKRSQDGRQAASRESGAQDGAGQLRKPGAVEELDKVSCCFVAVSYLTRRFSHNFVCALRDVTKLTQQLAENGAPIVYGSSSLSVAHWLSRLRGGGKGTGMQLGFDVMQRLLLSPPWTHVPAITKDPASMFQLGLTDEASPPTNLPLQAPDHTCFSRAFTFNAAPINGSIRSAIMQSTSLPYYYILSAQMQVTISKSSFPLFPTHTCFAELQQAQRLARPVVDVQQRARAQRTIYILAAAQLVDSHHVEQQNLQYCWSPRQWQDDAAPVLRQTRGAVARPGQHPHNFRHIMFSHLHHHVGFCIIMRLMFYSRVSNPVNLLGSTECGFLMRKMCAPSTGNQPLVLAFLATGTWALHPPHMQHCSIFSIPILFVAVFSRCSAWLLRRH
jgi:hypothetical protein